MNQGKEKLGRIVTMNYKDIWQRCIAYFMSENES